MACERYEIIARSESSLDVDGKLVNYDKDWSATKAEFLANIYYMGSS